MSERQDDSEAAPDGQSSRSTDREESPGRDAAGWFATSTLRVGLALIGFVLLLFALGQASGFDLLGLAVDAISSRIGAWLLVAVFALLIILLAVRGFGTWSE